MTWASVSNVLFAMPNISWIQIPSPLKTCHTLDHSFCRLGTVSIFPTFNWIGSPFPTFRFAALSTNVSIRFTSRLRSDEFFHHKFNTHHNRFRSTRTWSRLHRRLQRRLWRRVLHRSRTGRHGIKSVNNNWHPVVRGRSRRKVRIATKPRCWHVCFVSSGIHSDKFEQQDDDDDDDWHCWYEYVLQRMILQYSFYDDSRESHPSSSEKDGSVETEIESPNSHSRIGVLFPTVRLSLICVWKTCPIHSAVYVPSLERCCRSQLMWKGSII